MLERPKIRRFYQVLLFSLFAGALWHCNKHERAQLTPVQRIQQQGELVVLTLNSPTAYYVGRDGEEGLEYELATSFARVLGVPARFKTLDSTTEILAAIQRGDGHIAAAGLTRTPERERRHHFGPTYQTVRQQVVSRRDRWIPRKPADLVDLELMIIAESSYNENLLKLKKSLPELNWRTTEELETVELMAMVWEKELYCTIADSNIVAVNRRYYPELEVAFDISEPEELAWILAPDVIDLDPLLNNWLNEMKDTGKLKKLIERYYGHVERYDYVNQRTLKHRIKTRLPKYRDLFEQAARETGFSWTFLAAISYQESHWNSLAVSQTGVRGMMMLTLRTARSLGITNRMDPAQSIPGGARYLRNIYERISDEVPEPDRLWFALAAYNVGLGHLNDARELARREGRDPNAWGDVREMLPLLSKHKYYRTVRYGYARGKEPVRFVTRIRNYHDILERHFWSDDEGVEKSQQPDSLAD